MASGRPNGLGALGPWAPSLGLALALALLPLAHEPGHALDVLEEAVERAGTRAPKAWVEVGLLSGTTQFDAGLADYQWDTTPRLGWGVKALVGRGRLAAGLRLWRTSASQSIGDLGAPPRVRATSVELIGEGRLAEVLGTEVLATAGAGRLHLGYDPDRITIQPPGSGAIVVDLAPVGAWIGGGGLALRRAVARGWTVGLGVEARVFAIDTAHRAGNAIVTARESFGDWSARGELAWRIRRR